MSFKEVIIPHIDVNDDNVTIENIVFENSNYVEKNDVIFTVSTAKAVEDFICEYNGYIVYLVEDGDEIKMGDIASIIFSSKEDALTKMRELAIKKEKKITIKASQKAIKYAEKISFDISKIKKSGIIKVKDIEKYLKNSKKEV